MPLLHHILVHDRPLHICGWDLNMWPICGPSRSSCHMSYSWLTLGGPYTAVLNAVPCVADCILVLQLELAPCLEACKSLQLAGCQWAAHGPGHIMLAHCCCHGQSNWCNMWGAWPWPGIMWNIDAVTWVDAPSAWGPNKLDMLATTAAPANV